MNDFLLASTLFASGAFMAWAVRRLQLSLAKHRSLAGHARIAKRVAQALPGYRFGEASFFDSDGAPADTVRLRRAGLDALAALYGARYPKSLAATARARDVLSDLRFTGAYRVPFPYGRYLSQRLSVGSVLRASSGVTVEDLDGNVFHDLTGSYGVNVFGHDFYKACIAEGAANVQALGPVLGSYHPCAIENAERLREISGLDEVSFHMSGTEAVMQAVRLARYHTRRSHLVRFCGAYHGWWEDVQPGPGNPSPVRQTYTLKDMAEATMRVLRTRRDIACVLVNPLQALHPNRPAPGDSSLVDGGRRAGFDRARYTAWLKALREVCSARGIVLIFDEVFVGFRLAPGGAQAYFGVRADMVVYGKTLGGGLPVGAVCGRRELMQRYREDRPADVCFARGTFNSHPYVMGAMKAFLDRLETPQVRALYDGLDERWNDRAQRLNRLLDEAGVPVRVANLSSIWTVVYTRASRYHWLLQYYLRAEGLALSWVGTGRLIFSLDYDDADFDAVAQRFVAAAVAMKADGWWWSDATLTRGAIRRRMLRELLFHPRSAVAGVAHGVDQLAAQQVQRSTPVQQDVVERVGEDLRHPHQAGLDVLDDAQVQGAEQEAARA
jgi:glutamate-1-semialdehyde 2,1-aminomutase